MINAGRSLYEVQKLLGHTQIKTTQRYAHLSHESLLMAADTASSAVPWESAVKQAEKSSPMAKPAQAKALPNPESAPVAATTEPSDEEFSEET